MSPLPLPLSQLFNPRLTSLGRLEARSNLQGFPSEAALETGLSPWRISLDGDWRFQLAERPGAAPSDWVSSNTDQAPWRDIKVPGVWTRQGTGDLPHYANYLMPFDCQKPPAVPEDNATGLYRCTISDPDTWNGRKSNLKIEDQDHWNHGGLHRSVWLESRDATHLGDLSVETDFDPQSKAGTASVRAVVNGDSAGWSVRCRLDGAATP